MAMGDANNDIEMLQFAGSALLWEMPVTMSNPLLMTLQPAMKEEDKAGAIEKYIL